LVVSLEIKNQRFLYRGKSKIILALIMVDEDGHVVDCSGHCQELAPKYREAAAILATADLPRPVVLAKYDDSTDSQRRLRAGAEDGGYYEN
jgi:hypothetical protein